MELVTQNDISICNQEDFKEFANVGKNDFSPDDIQLEFLKISQFTSQIVKDQIIKPGLLYASLSGISIGESVDICVIKKETQWVKFENLALANRSLDGSYWDNGDKLTEEEKWKNKQTYFYTYLPAQKNVLPLIVCMSGQSSKTGKLLTNLLYKAITQNNEPIFSRVYTLTVEKMKNDKGDFFVFKINPRGFVSKEDAINCIKMRKMIDSALNIKIDDNAIADDIQSDSLPKMD